MTECIDVVAVVFVVVRVAAVVQGRVNNLITCGDFLCHVFPPFSDCIAVSIVALCLQNVMHLFAITFDPVMTCSPLELRT